MNIHAQNKAASHPLPPDGLLVADESLRGGGSLGVKFGVPDKCGRRLFGRSPILVPRFRETPRLAVLPALCCLGSSCRSLSPLLLAQEAHALQGISAGWPRALCELSRFSRHCGVYPQSLLDGVLDSCRGPRRFSSSSPAWNCGPIGQQAVARLARAHADPAPLKPELPPPASLRTPSPAPSRGRALPPPRALQTGGRP